LKKVCYKVSLCENSQQQSCKAFIGLTIRAKIIDGGDPFYLKLWVKLIELERNRRFSYIFARRASAVTRNENSSITLIGSPLCALQ